MLLFFDFWLKTIDDLRPELFFVLRLLFLLSTSLLSLSFSLSSFVFRSSFVVVSEKDGVLVSLSLVLFLNAEQM